ncbi:hypothetical protein AJ80_08182 [Polytolypa hystricis UAMH7299]|uniref:Histone chaperone domain-containing protein n=1 Tax=Polytolypa hystricis (strain UAMH7299) TaxID=1447883 RepID=A0A2B7XCG5_POLH7|nr:hypothetical protein AJ80_08182 [Polytolypa hystricis UAMH7299]
MSGNETSAMHTGAPAEVADKGKGRAIDNPPHEDVSMGEDEDSSSEESGAEEIAGDGKYPSECDSNEEEEDNLEPISTENIIEGGRRTRGKSIDYRQAAAKAQAEGVDLDDDEDDEDFRAPDEDVAMKD